MRTKTTGNNLCWKDETNHRPGQNIVYCARLRDTTEVVSGGGRKRESNEIYSIEYATYAIAVEAIKELNEEYQTLNETNK